MFVKTALKILASAALILPQSTVLGDKHVAPADTAPANVGTMTQNDGSDPDAKPWYADLTSTCGHVQSLDQ